MNPRLSPANRPRSTILACNTAENPTRRDKSDSLKLQSKASFHSHVRKRAAQVLLSTLILDHIICVGSHTYTRSSFYLTNIHFFQTISAFVKAP